jgi:hypothetical protein
MRILFPALILGLLITACNGQENPELKKRQQLAALADSVSKPKTDTLHFVVEDKPCYAVIDARYTDFKYRKEFPLSLFITLSTLTKDRNGHPDGGEASAHSKIQNEITDSLNSRSLNAFIGKTTMNGYEDLIFYIKKEDQNQIQSCLQELKDRYPRIREFTFEQDPEWEAVAEFYKALKKGMIN